MHADLHKIWIVGSTEFSSMLRTKSFLIGIMLLPVITGASVLIQLVVAQRVDTRTRTLAVVDRSGALYPFLKGAAETYNAQTVDAQGKSVRPRIEVSKIDQEIKSEIEPSVVLELSDRIRRGELDAFAVIPSQAIAVPSSKNAPAPVLEFHSDNPNDDLLRTWLTVAINGEVRSRRFRSAGIDQAIADRVDQPLSVENLGLFERADSAEEAERPSRPPRKSIRSAQCSCPRSSCSRCSL